MIHLHLTRADHYEGVYLRLPATPGEIGEAFAWLDGISTEAPTKIVDSTSNIPNLFQYIHNADVDNGNNLNLIQQIAEKTDELSEVQAHTLAGALDAEPINGLDDVLSVIDRIEEYTFIPDVTCDKELGGYLVENGHLDFPKRVRPYLDYHGIGAEYYAGHGGAYTSHGYVLRKSALEPYLEPYRDAVFRISLRSQQSKDPYLLILPATFERMAQARQSLGVGHISEAEITEIECTIPYLENLIPFGKTDIRKLDELAESIADMKGTDGELLKFCAVLEVECPGDVEEALELADALDDYERVTEGSYEYGQSVLRRHGADDELLQAMEGYMDFEKLGEDAMIEDGVRQTEFGLVRRLSEPFPEQGYGQRIGGI